MLVKLPHQCSGQEIFVAFKAASKFEDRSGQQWEPHEFIGEFQYEPGSVRQTIRSMGVCTQPYSLRKKWGLFGKKVLKPGLGVKFTLPPVVLSYHYDKIEVGVEYAMGVVYVATDPHTPEFEHIRPQLERVLGDFYAHLQPQTA